MSKYQVGVDNETNWVRSVYLYGVCLVALVVMAVGAVMSVVSLTTVIAPAAGMQNGWERVLVGGTEVIEEGLGIAEKVIDGQGDELPFYCEGDIDEADVDYCAVITESIAESADEEAIPADVDSALGIVRDEVYRQIRLGALGRLVAGLVITAIGALVFRRHRGLTALYADAASSPADPVDPPTATGLGAPPAPPAPSA